MYCATTKYLLSLVYLFSCINGTPISLDQIQAIENPEYWKNLGIKELTASLQSANNKIAKNVIIFIGDGMGISTITAARHYKRKLKKEPYLSFESFPSMALTQVILLSISAKYSFTNLESPQVFGHLLLNFFYRPIV